MAVIVNYNNAMPVWLVDPATGEAASASGGGLTDAELRATPVPVSGTVTTGGLTDAQLRATAVPVSGPLTDAQIRATALPVSGPLTDVQLRATAVPVSDTVAITAAQLPATLGSKAAADSVSIAPASDASFAVTGAFWQATQPVSGTFWQATQPVSAASLPLPTGAATAAKQDTLAALFAQPYPLATTPWTYAAATSGIANTTTAVTFKAADGSLRNYIVAFDIMWEALGTATELAIRDGAGGTVLWRMKIPASLAGAREVVLPVPIRGTAATLLEVVTLTASTTGAVYFNAQGFVAA